MNFSNYTSNMWIISNPVILKRILWGFFRAIVLKKNTLKTIELFPTYKCNLRCNMCSVEKYKKKKMESLTLDDYERIAIEGSRMGAIALQILGGEPMLADNLNDIIRIFKKHHFFIYIVSNATLITKERLHELHKIGLDAICFSLDSMEEKENDKTRGSKGHFKKVFESVQIAKDEKLIVSLAPVFFPNEIDKGIEVIKYCQKEGLGASGGQVAPVGGWEDGSVLTPEENDRVRSLLKKYPRLTFDWALSYFLKMRCPAGKEKIGILYNGDVVSCSYNPISFGNARDDSLEKIVNRMQSFSQFNKYSPVCLCTEDIHYIDTYLRPLKDFDTYPVYYKDHPAILPENEKALF